MSSFFVFLCSVLAILEKHVEEKVHFFNFLDYVKHFWCFLIEISIFSQQKWVNWLKNYLICFFFPKLLKQSKETQKCLT